MTTGCPGKAGRARRPLLVTGFVLACLAAGGVMLALGDRVAGGEPAVPALGVLEATSTAIVVWGEQFAAALLYGASAGERAATLGRWRSISGSWRARRSIPAVPLWPWPGHAWSAWSCWPMRLP